MAPPLPTKIQLHIVSAERSLVNETVDEVEIPGADGYFGVLPGHTPLLAVLGAGELWYRQGQEKHYFVIAFGFAEVQPDRVTILAQIAEYAHEIDLARAEAAKKRAEERLMRPQVDMDAERARISLLKSLIRLQVATRAKIRSSLFSNLANLLRYRGLISSLVARELKARYRGSVFGFLWSFINPLLLLLIYTFVFTTIIPNEEPKTKPYALFMFCGILPWTWFASSLSDAAGSLIAGGNLIKKVLFPAEVLPIVNVLANMVHFFLGLVILIVFLIVYQHPPDAWDLFWFPIAVVVQLVFTCALGLLLAALAVHFRDIRDILANVLTLWFFATPIIYPYFQANVQKFRPLFNLNPFTHLAISYQEILFFYGPIGHWRWLLALGAASVVLFLACYWVFDRLRDSFAEAV